MSCESCNVLGGNALAISHPKAIEISVATRNALDKGLLSATPNTQLRRPGISYRTNLQLVEDWAKSFKNTESFKETLEAHIVFVESEERVGVLVRDGQAVVVANPDFHADARLVTTRHTFSALLKAKIDADQASQHGLILFEGDRAELLRKQLPTPTP